LNDGYYHIYWLSKADETICLFVQYTVFFAQYVQYRAISQRATDSGFQRWRLKAIEEFLLDGQALCRGFEGKAVGEVEAAGTWTYGSSELLIDQHPVERIAFGV
jgi:hypothetical protein